MTESAQDGYELHPLAAQDITDLWEFIALTRGNPIAAGQVRADILSAIRRLVTAPQIGHRRPDLTNRPLRFWTVRDYLIVYAPDEHPLLVLAVLHGRRNPRELAAILRRRS